MVHNLLANTQYKQYRHNGDDDNVRHNNLHTDLFRNGIPGVNHLSTLTRITPANTPGLLR